MTWPSCRPSDPRHHGTTPPSRSSSPPTPVSTTSGSSTSSPTGSRSSPATASASSTCPAGSPTRCGSTTSTSTSPTTYDARRCPARAPTSSSSSWWPASSRARSTAAGRCGRSTSSRASARTGSRSSTSPTRRWSTACTRSTSASCSSTSHPTPATMEADDWTPRTTPSASSLVARALLDSVTEPRTVVDTATVAATTAVRSARRTRRRTRAVVRALSGRGPERRSAMLGPLSQQRRIVTVETRLADYRRIRDAQGGTINDVILATVTGALRAWLMTRTDALRRMREVRALVPVSVIDEELEATSLGSQIAAHFVTLPDRRDQSAGAAAPGVLLLPGTPGHRAQRGGQPARRDRRLRADDVPRDRLAGRLRRAAPRLPAVRHQRARARRPRCTPRARGCWPPTRCHR